MVLMVIVQMKEYENDLEMLVDFQYSLVKFYVSIFEFRKMWFDSMVRIYVKNGDFLEVVMCYVYVIVLVVEYFIWKGMFR